MTTFSYRLVRHNLWGGSPAFADRSVTLARVPDDLSSFAQYVPWTSRYTSETVNDLRAILREMELALDKPILDFPEDFNLGASK